MTEIVKHEPTTIYIKPSKGLAALNLRDLWVYRELVYFMVWRDVKVKYKQTLLGMAWAVIQPVMTMLVFTFLFGKVAKLPTDGIPYPVFSFTALLPWGLFTTALNQGSRSLVAHNNMVTKIYFPRLIIPISAVGAGLVDFFFAFLVLGGLMVFYRLPVTANLLWLPLFLLLALAAALAVGLWLSALNVQYRDIQHMVPFLLQAWMYASPVVYSVDVISAGPIWRALYALNPMVGVIQGFRWALLGGSPPDLSMLISAGVVIILLISGLFYFRHMERTFADTI